MSIACRLAEARVQTHRSKHLLPDGVAVGGVLAEVFEELQQGQLDALFSGDIGVAQQLMQSLPDVTRRILGTNKTHNTTSFYPGICALKGICRR